jgi:hypothetical protein
MEVVMEMELPVVPQVLRVLPLLVLQPQALEFLKRIFFVLLVPI